MYMVTFIATLSDRQDGYAETAAGLREIVRGMDGFLGFYAATEEGREVAVSLWRDLESIRRWQADESHKMAKKAGQKNWLAGYRVLIGPVEADHAFGAAVPSLIPGPDPGPEAD